MVDADGRRLDAGLPGRQGRLLFAYLVLNRSRGCPRDELIDVLWPEGPPAAADSALSALLSKLRRALGDGVLTGRGELRLRLEARCASTSRRRRAAILEAEAAMEAGDHALAAERARARRSSTDLQTFLPDAEGGWAAEQRRELETIRLRALETLAEAGLRQGGRELGRGRAGRARRDRRRAVPRVRAPAADGGPRGRGQPGRGAARVRGAALAAARGARDDARAGGDDRLRARAARRAAARAPRGRSGGRRAGHRAGSRRRGRRRWPPPSTATRSSGAASSSPTSSAAGARRPTGSARSSCWPATPGSARPAPPPSWPRAPTTTARSSSTGASTRRR